MVAQRRKKVARYRGSKTHGGGSMKKRRGAGHRGGVGRAGTGKRSDQKKPSIWKTKYFGKSGFTSKSTNTYKAITISKLESFLTKKHDAIKVTDAGASIDLTKLGYGKLLSKGKPTSKFTITVHQASPKAVEKIKSAGGSVSVLKQASDDKQSS